MRAAAPPSRTVSVLRAVAGVGTLAILGHAYAVGIPRQGPSLFDYFGYFTNLTSLLAAVLLSVVGLLGLFGRTACSVLTTTRAVAVSCMVIVALVYNLIVPGTGSAPAWVSIALHSVFPLALVVDWVLVPDRTQQPWSRIWLVLPYPITWLVVVLVRGATDGWVPYGFLLPERGFASLAATVAALLVALLAAAAGVWGLSRVPAPTSRPHPAVQP